jgi:hypothetical protein
LNGRALDGDELLRRLLRAWNQRGLGDFPWAHEDRLHVALRRLLDEMTPIVALGVVVGNDPALLVLGEDEARIVQISPDGVETLYLGALVGGTLTIIEEQIDLARVRVTLRYRHGRLPGDLVHVAETETEFAEQEAARAVLSHWSTDRGI